MEFELKRAGEKLEKEQKDRKEKATKMIEKEKKAKQEAAIRREAIEAAQRSRRIHAIESHQHKLNVNPVKDEPVASAANNSAPTASSSKAAVPPSTRPITENEVRAFLLHKAPIPPRDFVSHFKPRVQNKEDKQAFADILRRISKIQKANGHSHVILRGHPLLTTFPNTPEKNAKWVFDKLKGKPLKPLPDFLREYNLPPGLFPQNITCYEFDETKLMLVVHLPAPCEVCFKDQSVVRYATRVKGLVSRGKFTVIDGMKTKIVVWVKVTSVVVENYRSDKVWFTAGVKKSRPRDAYETPRDAIRVDDF